jgi:nicotinamide-nucleotide amidase
MPNNLTGLQRNSGMGAVRNISVLGLTEAAIGEQLSGHKQRFPQIKIGIETALPELRIKLSGGGSDRNLQNDLLEDAVRWVRRKLGVYVVSDTGQPIEHVVGALLLKKKATLAVAESCTGGLIADLLTEVPGSSAYFLLSTVTYANQAKIKVLGVRPQTLARHGAVSEQTAGEMARGAKNILAATYGLATSGIAGPGGGTDDKPVGTVCIGLATPSSVSGHRFNFAPHNRRTNKQIFAITALDLLRKELLDA